MSRIRKYWHSLLSIVQSALGFPIGVGGSSPIRNEVELLAFLLQTPELEKTLINFGIAPQVLLTAVQHIHPADKGSIKFVLKAIHRAKLIQLHSTGSKVPSFLNIFIAEIIDGNAAIRVALEHTGFNAGAFVFYVAHGMHEDDVATTSLDEASTEYGIELVNDNFTPMEFVVAMLVRHVNLVRTNAINAMLQIHHKNALFLPQNSIAKAQEIADAINRDARQHNFPLLCRVIAPPGAASPDSTPALNLDLENPSLSGWSVDQPNKRVGPSAESWVPSGYDRTPPWAEHFRSYQTHIGRNILAGIKVSLFRGISFDQLAVSWMQLVGLLLLSVLLPLATQILQVGIKGEFSASGLTGILFLFPIIVIAAIAVAKLSRQEEKTLALIIALSSASLSIELFMTLLPYLLKSLSFHRLHNQVNLYMDNIWSGWLTLATISAFSRLLQLSRKQRLFAAAIVWLLLFIPLHYVWMDRTLWAEPYDTDEYKAKMATYRAATEEEIVYLQPKLLSDQLKNILPGQSGANTIYFVGVAGDSEQDVFMKEINSVEKLFEDRFGSRTHAIKLINNRSTLKSTPMASTTSLKAAIQRVGEVMNPDSDILFLYLTSHGSKEHTLSIEFPPLQLKDLEPTVLRQMLDEAGIKWRVVVIAACYSGGFIDPIKSDNTLVITAAAGDRTSFGCSNENDYTYFGKAYFVDGLKNTDSFIKAFDVAKQTVTKREIKDGYEPSNPQISVGKNIEAELSQLDRHRQAAQL